MNFNVHRRNKSLFSQSKLREKRDQKSTKKMGHTSGEALLQQAKDLYYSQTHLEQAISLFQQYLNLHPKHNESLYLAAVALLHLGRADEAIDKLMAISEDYENKANALLLAAMAFNKLGNVGKSLETVNECIRKYEMFEEAICFRGKIYMGMNFYHKAEVDFKTIISSTTKPSFLSFVGLADCFRSQGKVEKALALYHRALEAIGAKDGIGHKQEIQLKMAICLYQLDRLSESHALLEELSKQQAMKSSQLFYYLGQCDIKLGKREQGLLNLEYCLRMQTNSKVAKKAFKKLLQLYLENYQFYEALNIVRLAEISKVEVEWWRRAVEAFMLIIKGQHQQGVKELTAILDHIKGTEEQKRTFKIKRDSSDDKSRRETRYHQESIDHTKKLVLASPSKNRDNYYSRDKISKKLGYFSTKSVIRAVPKIESTRINSNPYYSFKKEEPKFKTEHHPEPEPEKAPFSAKEKEFIMPLILLFKAYAEFFQNNFMKCLDTYEEYEAFIKDMFGRESDVTYNKTLCEALLMGESDMTDESLVKFSACVDIYYQKYETVPQEPLLYKIMLLIKLAILKQDEQEDASFTEILESTLEMIDNYKPAIGNHFLTHYFRSLIYILLDKLEESRDALERTFKVTEECSWKLLYVKGVVEMQLGNYYDAVKEFSAGLILQNRAEFYLGRSISFLRLSEKQERQVSDASIQMLMKSVHISSELSGKKDTRPERLGSNKTDLLIENCFEDLQKYIELQNNQEEISLWVSKILFANRAYDQAIRSLTKITQQTDEVQTMIECIEIYEGEFESGGAVGAVIKSAFDGIFLSEREESILLNEKVLKNYNSPEYGYLTSDYEKWLVVLHLYIRQQYPLLIKYLQKEIFACEDDLTHFLLRYNVAVVYYLMGDYAKGLNVFRGLLKYQDKFDIKRHIDKILQAEFDPDECLEELREEIGISCNKLLSNYLPYRPVTVSHPPAAETASINANPEGIKIYIRMLIPFPTFEAPSLRLSIDHPFIMAEMTPTIVEKRIDAPWIKKGRNKNIQFTEKLQDSVAELDDIGNTRDMKEVEVEEDN